MTPFIVVNGDTAQTIRTALHELPPMPHGSPSRRSFLAATLATGCGLATSGVRAAETTPELRVITPPAEPYCGWPTIARRADGELIVVWSGGRESHVCPFGQVRCITSRDDGRTWSWPRVLLDGAVDDRDSGVLETPRGTLLVTSFTSLAYEPSLAKAEKAGDWEAARLSAWQTARDRLTAEERQRELGTWVIRSTDGGRTWSPRCDSLVNSPHGPTALADGRLLYVGKQLWLDPPRIGAAVSDDDGITWQWLAEIPARAGDDPREYHELHAVQAPSGRIVAQIRNHNAMSRHETLQTESDDGGRTWTEPHAIGVWGYPSHLLRLKDGRLLMSYGHRRQPVGNQARWSADDGRTWSEPILISTDGTSTDLGYPSTAQLGDGTLLTVWYERLADRAAAVLRLAHWSLEA